MCAAGYKSLCLLPSSGCMLCGVLRGWDADRSAESLLAILSVVCFILRANSIAMSRDLIMSSSCEIQWKKLTIKLQKIQTRVTSQWKQRRKMISPCSVWIYFPCCRSWTPLTHEMVSSESTHHWGAEQCPTVWNAFCGGLCSAALKALWFCNWSDEAEGIKAFQK